MVSFPVLASFIFVKYARGFSTGTMFFNSFILAIPSFLIFGIARRSTDSAICPSVSVPASPYAAASFAPPTPNESITIVKIRLYFFGSISFPPYNFNCQMILLVFIFLYQSSKCSDCNPDRSLCIMHDRILHAKCISLLIAHNKEF